tara:strand:- start:58 stop:231 length:174 start_codon:yes stop_codon:yes gene_type:complete
MEYTEQQITDVVAVTGAEMVIQHMLGSHVQAVEVGIQLSHDGNGLTEQDIETIQALM